MREAIGGTWLFSIVIFFIMLFTGFMCLSINQSKAFNVKTKMIEAIERNNGIDLNSDINGGDQALQDIVSYLKDNAYRSTGKCPKDIVDSFNNIIGHYIGYSRDGKLDNNNPSFCIAAIDTGDKENTNQMVQELPSMKYYQIAVFYQLDIPVFHNLFMFELRGDTKVLSVSR